jgi:hypothetical protein
MVGEPAGSPRTDTSVDPYSALLEVIEIRAVANVPMMAATVTRPRQRRQHQQLQVRTRLDSCLAHNADFP